MALLKSVDNVPGINFLEYRDQNFYNKYEYRAKFSIYGLRFTWYADSIDEIKERLKPEKSPWQTNYERDKLKESIDKLEGYLNWRVIHAPRFQKNKQVTVRIEHNSCSVFSNDLQLLHTLDNLHPDVPIEYTQVQMESFSGIKYFVKEPKHKYRIYLKSKRVPDDFIEDLNGTLTKIKELYPSESLKCWITESKQRGFHWKFRYASSSHFIDYDDESTLSYLKIMHGEMLGKKHKLEKRPQPV